MKNRNKYNIIFVFFLFSHTEFMGQLVRLAPLGIQSDFSSDLKLVFRNCLTKEEILDKEPKEQIENQKIIKLSTFSGDPNDISTIFQI